MPKLFPYNDQSVPWKFDIRMISTHIGKKEFCSNVSLDLAALTRNARCYTFEEFEKRRKEISEGTTEPVRNKVTIEEAKEFLKTILKADYSVIQQLNKSSVYISIIAL